MQIIGIGRLSSREQAENSHAKEQQEARLRAAGADEIYFDIASGTKEKRPALSAALELVRDRRVEGVVCTRLDRLSRSLVQLHRILEIFRHSGVNLKVLDDCIDLSTVGGRFHANLLGSLAQMEVERLQERVRHGWEYRRKREAVVSAPWGFRVESEKLVLDHTPYLCLVESQEELSKAQLGRELVETFFVKKSLRGTVSSINQKYGIERHNHGYGLRGQYRGIFRWSPAGLSSWLSNPVLCGHTCYLRKRDGKHRSIEDWHVVYNTHPQERLMSDDESNQIREILARNKRVRGWGANKQRHSLSGLVFCARCGSTCYSLQGGTPNSRHYYYQCKNYELKACKLKKCFRIDRLEHEVINSLIERADQIANIANQPDFDLEPSGLQQLRQQLAALHALGYNPAIENAKSELQIQISEWEYQLSRKTQQSEELADLLLWVVQQKDFWKSLSEEEKQEYFRAFVDRVDVDTENIEVKLKV